MSQHVHLVPSLAGVDVGSTVCVEGAEAHHAVVVRRITDGEEVVLTDGGGRVAACVVTRTSRTRLEVVVSEVYDEPRPAPQIVVVQALPKGDRGEVAVEMLTEIGVARIVPWAAARSVAIWRGDRAAKSLSRWRSTAREAAKQSRRAWLPEVADLVTTAEVLTLVADADLALVLDEEAEGRLSEVVVPVQGMVLIVVGPEGGVSVEEVAALEAAGALSVRLGAEVLRTSTAGLAAVSSLLSRTPRWH